MFELDQGLREDLERLREQQGPSPATLGQIFAALELQLGDDPGPQDSGDDRSGGSPELSGGLPEPPIASFGVSLGFAAKAVGATVALTGAGLIALRLAVVALRAIAPEPASEGEPQQQRALEPTRSEAPPSSADEFNREVEAQKPELGLPPSMESLPDQAEARSAAATSKRGAPEPVDSLALELAMLEAAHAASDPEAALVELERHRRRFPNGQLADEREILRVEAMCGLGHIEAAREAAARFLAVRSNSPLRPRMRRACAAIDRGEMD